MLIERLEMSDNDKQTTKQQPENNTFRCVLRLIDRHDAGESNSSKKQDVKAFFDIRGFDCDSSAINEELDDIVDRLCCSRDAR